MAYIKAQKHPCAPSPRRGPATAAAFVALALPAVAPAQTAAPASTLPEVRAKSSGGSDYKPEQASSPKLTSPLLDTPQTITIVPAKVLEEQNRVSLVEALSTVPGITFGAGEGGGGYGDSINFRGYSANNNITIDGMRDSAQYNRSDAFNLDSVEVMNGASSVYGGVGSVSGSINLVSKAPLNENLTRLSLGLGTDQYRRGTVDFNRKLGDTSAVRLNLMAHGNDVPGRDVETFERWGVAPSIAFGLNTPTRVTLSYFHQSDDNIPQYGVPYFKGAANDGPLPGVDPSNYYGYRNIDKQKIDVDRFTVLFEHRFSDTLRVRNQTRLQRVEQTSVVDAVQGTWCLASNLTPLGTPCVSNVQVQPAPAAPVPITVPAGFYLPSGPRGLQRDTTNTMIANQTDFTSNFKTGDVEHTLVTGFAFTHEKFDLDSARLFRNADGSDPYIAPAHLPFMDISNPDNVYDGPINYTLTGRTKGDLDNAAIYAFDTLKLTPQWELNGGLRYEHNKGSSQASTAAGVPLVETWAAPADNSENLLSYRLGLVYKPQPTASYYVAFGNSKTPSKASVNGSCVAPNAATPALSTNCNVKPETALNVEIGGKWDVLDNRMLLTAAIFRNELRNFKVASNDIERPEQVLDGRSRIDGLALGATGQVTSDWGVFANYTYLKSKVLRGTSKFCVENPTVPACVTALNGSFALAGDPLGNVPKHSASLWTTYRVMPSLTLGYGASYQGSFYVGSSAGTYFKSDAYWVHNLMASYRVSRGFDVQLNVKNLADKEYYTRIRNNGWATPGDGRAVTVSGLYAF